MIPLARLCTAWVLIQISGACTRTAGLLLPAPQ